MMNWFSKLPVHQKLVAMALAITTIALLFATTGLVAANVWRYRTSAFQEASALATVIAENTAAAVAFDDAAAARASLETARLRPSVRRACLYLPDQTLFAGFARAADLACPPAPPVATSWTIAAARAPVTSADREIATVYIERELVEIGTTVAIGASTGIVMLLLSAALAFAVAQRLHRTISTPLAQLAAAAKTITPDTRAELLPTIQAGEDEIGDLVKSFDDMLRRLRDANAERDHLLAREREASRLKDEFLAAVSHELRTPLNAIVGWIQILTLSDPPAETRTKALASLERNSTSLTRLIEDLVDVSRTLTGKLNLRFEPLDLRDVVEGALEAIRPAAQVKGVELEVEVARGTLSVNGDRERLQQTVWNLASNAVKFTPPGGRVSVRLRAVDRWAELEVTDTGVGIPTAFLPHVFDRFRQADGSMTREHGGLGLGLAIVKELITLHGGDVSASSAGAHRGATFVVRLPRHSGRHPRRQSADPERHIESHALAGVHVLAVDDNADALDLLSTALTAAGARVTIAASGDEAIRKWNADTADVLVCDLAMPHMDGFEVLKAIRRTESTRGHAVAAIAVTAHVSPAHIARAKAAGFQQHVGKPYSTDELIQRVLSALERQEEHM